MNKNLIFKTIKFFVITNILVLCKDKFSNYENILNQKNITKDSLNKTNNYFKIALLDNTSGKTDELHQKEPLLIKTTTLKKNIVHKKKEIFKQSTKKTINKLSKNINIKKRKFSKSETCIILSHGLGDNKKSMYNLKLSLSKYGNIIIPCRSKCNHLSINQQAKFILPIIKKCFKLKKLKKIIFIGHSFGGNINLRVLKSIIVNHPKILDKIIKNKIEIRLVMIGTPILGSKIAKELPNDFLKLIGLNLSYIGMKEITQLEQVTKNSSNDFNIINKFIGKQTKILPIIGKSSFIKNITKKLKNCNIFGTNLISIFKKLKLLNIENVDSFYKKLESLDANDGIVTIESQRAEKIIPNNLLLKKNISLFDATCHTSFFKYVPSIMRKGIPNEEAELKSKNVFQEILYAIEN